MHHITRRLSPSLIVAIAALFAGAVALPAAASAAPIQSGSTYKLFAAHTSNAGLKVMDVQNGSTADGAAVVISSSSSSSSQRWRVDQVTATPFGTPVYRLTNQNSQKCLDIAGASPNAGAPAIQFACHGGQNQQFFIHDVTPGSNVKTLIARHSGLVLDVANASTASGTPIGQFFNNGQKNQQFAMIRLN